jgi:predicted nucleotidyltransferase
MAITAFPLSPIVVARIHEIARRHGVGDVRLFGSQARGEAGPGGDLDLLIRLQRGRGFRDYVDFREELERALVTKVDVVTEDGLSPLIRDQVLAEALPL